jgi:hypothetical protein
MESENKEKFKSLLESMRALYGENDPELKRISLISEIRVEDNSNELHQKEQ